MRHTRAQQNKNFLIKFYLITLKSLIIYFFAITLPVEE